MLRSIKDLTGFTTGATDSDIGTIKQFFFDCYIHATDGDIGHVSDFVVDDQSWAVRYMVVDTTNWWPGKKVLVAPAWIEIVDWGSSTVRLNVARAQVQASPEYDHTRAIERPYETRLYGYYGRQAYWGEYHKTKQENAIHVAAK